MAKIRRIQPRSNNQAKSWWKHMRADVEFFSDLLYQSPSASSPQKMTTTLAALARRIQKNPHPPEVNEAYAYLQDSMRNLLLTYDALAKRNASGSDNTYGQACVDMMMARYHFSDVGIEIEM